MIGLSLTYNGIYLGGSDYGLLVERAARLAVADPMLDLQTFGGRDGSASQGATLIPKYWTDVCMIRGNSPADLQTKIDNVMFVLDPRLGEKLLKYDREVSLAATLDRQYYARINGPLVLNYVGLTAVRFNINWVVPSGRAIGLAQESEVPTIAASPQTFYIPVSASELVGGNNVTEPVYTFRNNTGADITVIQLMNVTLTQSLQWSGALVDTHYWRVDSERQTVERSADGTTYTTAISGMTAGNAFPQLAPRVRNQFTLTGFTSASNVTVTFWEKFI